MRRGLSMNRLAEMAGLSLTMVSYVERGMRNPTLDTLLRITDALEIDLGALITKAEKSAQKT
jgi:transcriptional regulator with XRE-family HTH domain